MDRRGVQEFPFTPIRDRRGNVLLTRRTASGLIRIKSL